MGCWKKYQVRLQLWFERIFSSWADIVSKRTLLVFSVSLVIQIGLSKQLNQLIIFFISLNKPFFEIVLFTAIGNIFARSFENDVLIWTPAVSQDIPKIFAIISPLRVSLGQSNCQKLSEKSRSIPGGLEDKIDKSDCGVERR